MKTLWLAISVLVTCTLAYSQTDSHRDGNWWLQQSTSMKYGYTIGFMDGMTFGRDVSIWKSLPDKSEDECRDSVQESFKSYFEKYFLNVTNTQLADGLDEFYKDYRNRKIQVDGAIWLVVNAIAGTPKEELEKMTESWRRNAH